MRNNQIIYSISEEIVRFTFEVHVKRSAPEWNICFTNPTAGPWKTITYETPDSSIKIGRYEREEQRPDLILLNNSKSVCLIVEAKDEFSKISSMDQINKSFKVFKKEVKRFQSCTNLTNYLRNKLCFIDGFLWYSSDKKSADIFAESYYKETKSVNPLVCILIYKLPDNSLACGGSLFFAPNTDKSDHIISSFQELMLKRLS
ncbi:MAG TPA: hypothetical protein PKY78_01870 [Candidatus Omnitrophota bacterium]|nr:hypothetical protein [Candidatus Omnitrophota bacterium]